jgi:hypothetical protein
VGKAAHAQQQDRGIRAARQPYATGRNHAQAAGDRTTLIDTQCRTAMPKDKSQKLTDG